MFKRIISCIAIWIMFLATVVSYFLFISGDDYGNFELFYWSVVSITFANGFSSNFGFAVNWNSTMYGAGIPASSFVTFIVHNTYKYFYNKFFWDDYDYKLVVVQYAFTAFFLALTGALWTWNEVKQMGAGSGSGGGGVEIDIGQAPTANNADGGLYKSGDIEITVTKQTVNKTNVAGGEESTTWRCYKHSSTNRFILKNITHSDVDMTGTGGLTANMRTTFTNVTAVYVYYKIITPEKPMVICIYENSTTKSWYKAGKTASEWNDAGSGFTNKDPSVSTGENAVTDTELNTAVGGSQGFTPSGGPNYTIKLDKRPLSAGVDKKIKYRTKGTDIEVEKNSGDSTVPSGYVAYEHKPNSPINTNVTFKFNGQNVEGISTANISIETSKPFKVYYREEDTQHTKPLLAYFQTNETGAGNKPHKYYGRGTKNFQMEWRLLTEKEANKALSKAELKPYLNMMSRQGTFKELVYFDNKEHWSPILMLSFSLGTIYAFYPTISPYSLIDPERAEKIDLWIAVTCAIPNFVLAVMDTLGDSGHGPGARWENDGSVYRQYYHYVWLIGGVPYLICLYVFFSTLHFPDGWIGRHVKDNLYVVGFFGVTFNTVQELMESTGFGGGDKQSHDGFFGSISQFSVLLMLITCVCTMFSCDGYLKKRHLIWG